MAKAKTDQASLIPKGVPTYEHRVVALDRMVVEGAIEPPQGLVESIENYGILIPPIVRKARTRNKFVVIDGRRRIRAAEKLGIPEIEVRITTGAGEVLGSVLTLQANSLRSQNAVAELHAIEKLIEKGATEKDLVQATGLKVQTVRSRLRMLDLGPEIRVAWESGEIPTGVATEAAKLDKRRQKRLLGVFEEKGKLTHHDVEDVRRVGRKQESDSLSGDIFDSIGVTPWQEKVRGLLQSAKDLVPDGSDEHLRAYLEKALEELPVEEGAAK